MPGKLSRRSFLAAPLIAGLIWSPFGSAAHAAYFQGQTYSAAYDQVVNFATYGGLPAASAATNTAAVTAFNTAYAAMSGRTLLVINPGTYNFNGFNIANTLGIAGSRLTISAYGVTITAASGTQGVAIVAGIIQGADNAKETRIDSVSAGAITVTLKTVGETSRFSVGGWACVGGINMQGAGDPPNQGIFEYKKIQSIGVGTLTFTEPLEDAYQDTWPLYTLGRGGPATVFPMQGFWDQEVDFQGARFTDTGNLIYGKTRIAEWTDCTFDTYGPCPTVNNLFRATRCIANGFGGLEVDKCINRIEFLSCDIRAIDFQSASVNHLYVLNHTATNASGTPRWNGGARKSNTFANLAIGTGGIFRFGPMNYGIMGPTTMTNCSSPSADFFNQTTAFADYTEVGGGVLSYAGGPGTSGSPSHWWATPGGNAVLLDSSNNFARSFQISDVSQSGGNTIITTNLPFPLPATINGRSAPFKIVAHPCADLTMTGCTGNALFVAQSLLPAHTPFQSWTL
jgi:hypothetical protein